MDLTKPKEEEQNGRTRIKDGCLFLSMAKPLGDTGRMDWNNKIIMKLDPIDITTIITGCRANQFPVKLFHKSTTTNTITTLEISPGERAGTYKWFLNKAAGEQKSFINIYLDNKDMFYMFTMMEAALPIINGWA